MSREGWIAAGVVAVVGYFALRGRRRTRPSVRSDDPRLLELHPEARSPIAELLGRVRELGLAPRIVSARRSCAEQRALYAQGRTAPGAIVTGANGCYSWHVLGRAVDLDAPGATDATWRELAAWWKSRGGVWGGDFPNLYDPTHFEWHPGIRIADVCPDPNRCEDVA